MLEDFVIFLWLSQNILTLTMLKLKENVSEIISRPNIVKNVPLQFHNDAGGTKTFPPTHSWVVYSGIYSLC
jgi:hypothetical protein